MMSNKNQRIVENHLRDALKIDRARIQTSRISRFGLLEMSRQRMRPSLGDSTQITCPRCKGQGTIRNVESVALSVLRLIEEEAMKKGTEKVIAHLSIECATFLLNEKRSAIESIENRLAVDIVILPSKHLETPAYAIDRIKEKESADEKPSYVQIKTEDIAIPEFAQQVKPKTEKPVIKEFLHDSPAPVPVVSKNESASLIKRFWHKLVGKKAEDTAEQTVKPDKQAGLEEDNRSRSKSRNNRRGQSVNKDLQANRSPRSQQSRDNRQHQPGKNSEYRSKVQHEERSNPTLAHDKDKSEKQRHSSSSPDEKVLTPASFEIAQNFDEDTNRLTSGEQANTLDGQNEDLLLSNSEGEQRSRQGNKKNGSRRGGNRRRSRNSNRRRPDGAGEDNTQEAGTQEPNSGVSDNERSNRVNEIHSSGGDTKSDSGEL